MVVRRASAMPITTTTRRSPTWIASFHTSARPRGSRPERPRATSPAPSVMDAEGDFLQRGGFFVCDFL